MTICFRTPTYTWACGDRFDMGHTQIKIQEDLLMNTRKAFGKILVVALFVLLFTLLLTVSASAATHDVATEADLTTALTNAADGDTINVTEDITLTAAITLNKQLTFEGNGKTITTSTVGVPFNVESDVTFNNISLTNTKSASHLFGI